MREDFFNRLLGDIISSLKNFQNHHLLYQHPNEILSGGYPGCVWFQQYYLTLWFSNDSSLSLTVNHPSKLPIYLSIYLSILASYFKTSLHASSPNTIKLVWQSSA